MTVFDMLYLARRIEELEARIRALETRQSPETYMTPSDACIDVSFTRVNEEQATSGG